MWNFSNRSEASGGNPGAFFSRGGMIISGDKAVAVYKKVAQIRAHYRAYNLVGDSNRLSIEDFHRTVADLYQVTITKAQVAFSGSYVRGMMERYDNLVKIRVRLDQDQDWKRFTAVKELCHVIIDEVEDWSTDGVETIKDLLMEYTLESGVEARRVMQSEALAELAAIELMYPYDCRSHDISLLASASASVTEAKIAHYYGLPAVIVGRALNAVFNETVAKPIWSVVGEAA